MISNNFYCIKDDISITRVRFHQRRRLLSICFFIWGMPMNNVLLQLFIFLLCIFLDGKGRGQCVRSLRNIDSEVYMIVLSLLSENHCVAKIVVHMLPGFRFGQLCYFRFLGMICIPNSISQPCDFLLYPKEGKINFFCDESNVVFCSRYYLFWKNVATYEQ